MRERERSDEFEDDENDQSEEELEVSVVQENEEFHSFAETYETTVARMHCQVPEIFTNSIKSIERGSSPQTDEVPCWISCSLSYAVSSRRRPKARETFHWPEASSPK